MTQPPRPPSPPPASLPGAPRPPTERSLTGHLPRRPPAPPGHLSAPPPPERRAAHPPSPKALRARAAEEAMRAAQQLGIRSAAPPGPVPQTRPSEPSRTRSGPTTATGAPTATRTTAPGHTTPPDRAPRLSRMGAPLPAPEPVVVSEQIATRSRNYLLRHWRGELPLAVALIVSGALLWLAVQGLEAAQRAVTMTEQPVGSAALWLTEVALLVVGALWWGAGVARAAIEHANRGGSAPVALLAGATGLGAFVWAAMFWWQSARHVAPDVWAIVSGTLRPAAVHVEAATGTAIVEGDLEFGSMRALRAALDANTGIRRVKLESRGGRVSEGLALGRLIAARNLDTIVTGECSSACVTAFAGGRQRLISARARMGLHSAGGPGSTPESVARANRVSDEFIASRGVDLRVLEKGAAVAHDAIWFPEPYVLLASGLATDYAPR